MFWFIYTLPKWTLYFLLPAGTLIWYTLRHISNISHIKPKYFTITLGILLFVWCTAVLFSTVFSRVPGTFGGFQPLFASYWAALEQPEIYRSNFMNMLLFFPGGLLLTTLLPLKKKWVRIVIVTLLLGLLSAGIEYAQFCYQLGRSEADDILHNTLGSLLGGSAELFVEWLLRHSKKEGKA